MNALIFNDITLNPVSTPDGQFWITSADLANALGYEMAGAITKLYNRHKGEFTSSMTQVIDFNEVPKLGRTLKTGAFSAKTRIFSLRGCHLLAMFARTKIAKEFRKWVLDVLDKEVEYQSLQKRLEALQVDLQYIDSNLSHAGRFLTTAGKQSKPKLQSKIQETLALMQPLLPFDDA